MFSKGSPMNQQALDALAAAGYWAVTHWQVLAVFIGLFVAVRIPTLLAWLGSLNVTKDPRRLYTKAERVAGFALAKGRCEFTVFKVFRCTRAAEHGDHHIPHSKGGATSMENFVAGCSRCNIRKSDHMPGWWDTLLITARRRRYYPEGYSVHAGQRFGEPARNGIAAPVPARAAR